MLRFRKEDNASGVAVQELPYVHGSVATCLEQEDNPYNLSVSNAVKALQPSLKDRTNYRLQYLVLDRACDNNYYRVSVDVKGFNRFDYFSSSVPYKTIEVTTAPVAMSTTWADTLVETQLADKVKLGVNLIIERLRKIANLKRGWDSYEAEPIESATIIRAIDFFSKIVVQLDRERRNNLPVPFVAPLSDGGIQFEWRTLYKELIIVVPKSIQNDLTYLKVEKDIFGEIEEKEASIVVDDAIQLATTWLLS